MPADVLIIGCGRAKIWSRESAPATVRAADAYCGSLFLASRRFAERFFPACWYILSAHYGLLRPDDQISNYDATVGQRIPQGMQALLALQIREVLPSHARIYSVASARYSDWLASASASRELVRPLDGVPMFQRMQLLSRATATGILFWPT